MSSPSFIELEPVADAAEVAAGDLVCALGWLGETTRLTLDLDRMVESLAGQQLRLDRPEGARAIQRCITDFGLPVAWAEMRLRDAGRRPCILIVPRTGAVVFVHNLRFGFHDVRISHNGRIERQRLTTGRLASLLGLAQSSTVAVIAASPRLPLEALRHEDDPHTHHGHHPHEPHPHASPWQRARALLRLEKSDIRLTFVYGIAIGLLAVAMPIAVQALVNTVALGSVLDPLVVLTVLVAVVLAFAGLLRVLHSYVVESIQVRMFIRAAGDLTRRVFAAPLNELDRTSPVDLTARFLEVPVMQKAVAILLVEGIDLLLRLSVGLTLLAIYHPTLLVFSVLTLLLLAVVIIASGRGAVETALHESDAKYKTVAWLEETVRLAGVVRTEAGRRRSLERADHLVRKYRDARHSHFLKLVRTLVGGIGIQVVGSTVLLGVGGALVVNNELTLGQLVAAELMFASIASAMVKLHKQLEAVYDVVASAKKFAALLDIPVERRTGERLETTGPMSVRLHNATLGYESTRVIHASLDIAPGDRLAIAGTAGAGKTTLLESLATIQPLLAGELLFDGEDVRQLSLHHLRGQIVCLRNAEMASDTIEANLRLARPDVSLEEIEAVLEMCELTDAIAALPDGLQTVLSRTGRPLSFTAVRRLALARALIARPRLLLVDRGLDELGLYGDKKTRVLDAVFGVSEMTMIVVADESDVFERCTRQLHLADGQLVEAGP